MKKIRVFQAFKTTNPAPRRQSAGSKRRIVPGFFPKNLGTILLFLLMLPYLITFLFGNLREGGQETSDWGREEGTYEGAYFVNNTTALGNESIPLEIYVADRLTRSIDEDFEMEAAKAQAVLIRSGLMAFLYEQGENLGNRREIQVTDEGYGSMPATELAVQAVSQTKGVCLMYQNRPVSGAYFAVSNGATRNGEELSLTDYPYLKSVLCSRDFLSADYASQVSLRKNEFDRLWQEAPAIEETLVAEEKFVAEEKSVTEETPSATESLSATEEEKKFQKKEEAEQALGDISIWRDSAGYVLYVERGGKIVTGEQFRESFFLASASFHLEEEEEKILITVKGTGHGLGMSQFGANEMAKEGEDYTGILEYFFEDVTFTKFE